MTYISWMMDNERKFCAVLSNQISPASWTGQPWRTSTDSTSTGAIWRAVKEHSGGLILPEVIGREIKVERDEKRKEKKRGG